jgi:hypothetical protein
MVFSLYVVGVGNVDYLNLTGMRLDVNQGHLNLKESLFDGLDTNGKVKSPSANWGFFERSAEICIKPQLQY